MPCFPANRTGRDCCRRSAHELAVAETAHWLLGRDQVANPDRAYLSSLSTSGGGCRHRCRARRADHAAPADVEVLFTISTGGACSARVPRSRRPAPAWAAPTTRISTSRSQFSASAACAVAGYRLHMRDLAKLSPLEIWHSRIELPREIKHLDDPMLRRRLQAILHKAGRARRNVTTTFRTSSRAARSPTSGRPSTTSTARPTRASASIRRRCLRPTASGCPRLCCAFSIVMPSRTPPSRRSGSAALARSAQLAFS